ncbi:MAG: hypothetical protein JWM41_486 [Gemmatimonadetes bacterium]|nr:hypothetical protein [Gemmatimonadota bacterium]
MTMTDRIERRARAPRLAAVSLFVVAALLTLATPAAAQACFVTGQIVSTCTKPMAGQQPAAVAGRDKVFLFVRGSDNAVWVTTRPTARAIPRVLGVSDFVEWSPWASLGGNVGSGPSASARGDQGSVLDVFAQGSNGHLVHTWYDGGKWSSWEDLGGAITSSPASISTTANNVDVFARGTDNGLAHRAWVPSGWRAWEKIPGGILTSAPGVASLGNGNINVFAAGTDTHMYHTWSSGGAWAKWEDLGCCIVGAPAAVSTVPGQLFTIARGTNDGLYAQSFTGNWSGWNSALDAHLGSPPAVINYAYNSAGARRTAVYAINTDASPYEMINDGSSWTPWFPVSTLPGYQIFGVSNCIDRGQTDRSLALATCDPNSMRQRFISVVDSNDVDGETGTPRIRIRTYTKTPELCIERSAMAADSTNSISLETCAPSMTSRDTAAMTAKQKAQDFSAIYWSSKVIGHAAVMFRSNAGTDKTAVVIAGVPIPYTESSSATATCLNAAGSTNKTFTAGAPIIGYQCVDQVNNYWWWR